MLHSISYLWAKFVIIDYIVQPIKFSVKNGRNFVVKAKIFT